MNGDASSTHNGDDMERRMNDVERILFGRDDPSRGLVSRFYMTESIALELKGMATKIQWLLITAIIIALLNLIMGSHSSAPNTSQSMKIGTATEPVADSRKTWLTVQEVAAREKVDERTITNYIAREMIDPPPVKDGKSYKIALDYRIIPKGAEPIGTVAKDGKEGSS